MHAAIGEFMVAADMVEMGVARDAEDGAAGENRHMAPQADMAEA
jgi:hypothetical protein